MSFVLAIDVGSTSVKLLLTDGESNEFLHAFHPNNTDASSDVYLGGNSKKEGVINSRDYFDLIWKKTKSWLVKTLPNGEKIIKVGITSHVQSALIIAKNGQHFAHMHRWDFPIDEAVGYDFHKQFNGEWPGLMMSSQLNPKGNWMPMRLRNWALNYPDAAKQVYERGGYALQVKDGLNYDLCGEFASDARSMRGWLNFENEVNAQLSEWVGLGDICPPILEPQEILGRVSREGAEISGITEMAQVIVGCDDFSAGIHGFSARDRTLLNMANTTEHLAITLPFDKSPLASQHAKETGLSFLAKCGDLKPVLYSSTGSGGGTLRLCLPRIDGFPISEVGLEDEGYVSALNWLVDIMGERPEDGLELDIGFDAELFSKRGLNPKAKHIGGWDGNPSHLSPRIHAWVIFEALVDSLQPIRYALLPFTNEGRPVKIGGGLSLIGPVLESRAARWPQGLEVVASREISARGIIRLLGIEIEID